MSKETKVTAVEWYKSEVLNLHIDLESKQITLGEFAVKYVEIFEQAKEMEKQQAEYFFECGRNFQLTGETTFTEAYSETYGN
jgi:hypothetical protein